MRVTTNISAAVLCAVIDGDFDLAAALDAYSRVLSEAADAALGRVLIDCRGLRGMPTEMQRYDFGVAVAALHTEARKGGGRSPRVALFGSAPLLVPRGFGETVASNRGADVRVCETMEEAAAWLDVDVSALGITVKNADPSDAA